MVFILLEKQTTKNYLSDVNDLICAGVVSQHPPKIVAPESLNSFTNSSILLGDKSFLLPKNSFGCKKSFLLLVLLLLDNGAHPNIRDLNGNTALSIAEDRGHPEIVKMIIWNNYALIESLEIDLSSGFSVFTGETGSGKTILLGALQLIIGERADFKVLFNKDKKCTIEGIFDASVSLNSFLSFNDLDLSDEIIVRREIHPSGKSRAFVNDSPVKLGFLKELGFLLIDFHGQHQTRLLSKPDYQYSFIDNLGKNNIVLSEYRIAFDLYQSKHKKLKAIQENELAINNQRDFLVFQLDELNKYSFENWDENEITEEFELLSNFESIKHLFVQIENYNDGNDSIALKINDLSSLISSLANKLPAFKDFESRVNSIYLELNELFLDLEKKQPSGNFDSYRMNELDEKLQLSACNEIAQLCGINIKDLPSTALRAHKENERILTPKDMKQYDIKKDMCLKSFDAQISGKITGFISAKVTMKTGGHQDNVFEEIDTLADWWVNHKNRSEEILILLVDTDLVDKLSIIEEKYKQYSNILMFNHYAFQKFMIDNYFQ